MGFFPQLSNVYPELQTLLETSNNTNKPWLEGGVSGLSTWVRLVSTVDVGLVMQIYSWASTFENRYGNSEKLVFLVMNLI